MIEILFVALAFGCVVSIITYGVSSASENGALLNFLYELIDNGDKLKKLDISKQINELKQESHNVESELFVATKKSAAPNEIANLNNVLRAKQIAIDMAKERLASLGFFKKPIITCPKCMPSVWGTLIAIYPMIEGYLSLPSAIIGIFFAMILNSLLLKILPINRDV